MDWQFASLDVFAPLKEVVSVKVRRNKLTNLCEGYGFIEFANHFAAESALKMYKGAIMPQSEQFFCLNWAGEKWQDDTSRYYIYVGNLAHDVTDIMLEDAFGYYYPSVEAAKVIIDHTTKRSRGFGYVRFGDEGERQRAMAEMNGVALCKKPMMIRPAGRSKVEPAGVQQRSRGFGYVRFGDEGERQRAIAEMNGVALCKKPMMIRPAGRSKVEPAGVQQTASNQNPTGNTGKIGLTTGCDAYGNGAAAQQDPIMYYACYWGYVDNQHMQGQWNYAYYGYGQGYDNHGNSMAAWQDTAVNYANYGYGNCQQTQQGYEETQAISNHIGEGSYAENSSLTVDKDAANSKETLVDPDINESRSEVAIDVLAQAISNHIGEGSYAENSSLTVDKDAANSKETLVDPDINESRSEVAIDVLAEAIGSNYIGEGSYAENSSLTVDKDAATSKEPLEDPDINESRSEVAIDVLSRAPENVDKQVNDSEGKHSTLQRCDGTQLAESNMIRKASHTRNGSSTVDHEAPNVKRRLVGPCIVKLYSAVGDGEHGRAPENVDKLVNNPVDDLTALRERVETQVKESNMIGEESQMPNGASAVHDEAISIKNVLVISHLEELCSVVATDENGVAAEITNMQTNDSDNHAVVDEDGAWTKNVGAFVAQVSEEESQMPNGASAVHDEAISIKNVQVVSHLEELCSVVATDENGVAAEITNMQTNDSDNHAVVDEDGAWTKNVGAFVAQVSEFEARILRYEQMFALIKAGRA